MELLHMDKLVINNDYIRLRNYVIVYLLKILLNDFFKNGQKGSVLKEKFLEQTHILIVLK